MKIISSCFRSLCFLFFSLSSSFFPSLAFASFIVIRPFHCVSEVMATHSFSSFTSKLRILFCIHWVFQAFSFCLHFSFLFPMFGFFSRYVLFGSACFSIHASVFFCVLFCLVFTSHYVFFPYQFIFLSLCCFDQGLRSMLILSQQSSFFLSLAIQCLSFVNASIQLSNDANRRRRRWRWLFTTLFYHRYYQCNCSLLLVAILNDWVSICVN